MDKKTMRLVYKKARTLFTGKIQKEAEEKIQERVSSYESFMLSHVVMLYLALPDEVSTDSLVSEAFRQGKRVVVPYCKSDSTIGLAEIHSLDDVETGTYGIREPKGALRNNIKAAEIDLVIAPGVAFDKKGNRLGMGKGFYDRFLGEVRSHSAFIGLAFECQMTERVPTDKHDLPVDVVITENRIYDPTLKEE